MEAVMIGDKRLIQSIKLQNLLSFGPDAGEIELKSLNVLIGPNASGKSNLIEAIFVVAGGHRLHCQRRHFPVIGRKNNGVESIWAQCPNIIPGK